MMFLSPPTAIPTLALATPALHNLPSEPFLAHSLGSGLSKNGTSSDLLAAHQGPFLIQSQHDSCLTSSCLPVLVFTSGT